MAARKFRLDRFLSSKTGIPKGDIRLLLAQKRVVIDGEIATSMQAPVNYFSCISLDGEILQNRQPNYIMLHKPPGILSATADQGHKTVIDSLRESGLTADVIADLHIVGRLDLHSSGLLLLTNDSDWSRRLMSPEHKIAKVYEVALERPITDACIQAFAEGMYFPFENSTTLPAKLERLSETQARVTLMEGKYHQIKRMFGRFRNPVLGLHRLSIGAIRLDPELKAGAFRMLSESEYRSVGHAESQHH